MHLVRDLLAQIPQQNIHAYESYLQVHLKLLMTSINKERVQNLTDVQMKKDKCIKRCYQRYLSVLSPEFKSDKQSVSNNTTKISAEGFKNFNTQQNAQKLHNTVEDIRICKQSCGAQKKSVKKYLDDINYYSMLKMQRCNKSCNKLVKQQIIQSQNDSSNPETKNTLNTPQKNKIDEIKFYNPEYNQCLWACYNKLDRRYKVYWQEQKDLVRQKFKNNQN